MWAYPHRLQRSRERQAGRKTLIYHVWPLHPTMILFINESIQYCVGSWTPCLERINMTLTTSSCPSMTYGHTSLSSRHTGCWCAERNRGCLWRTSILTTLPSYRSHIHMYVCRHNTQAVVNNPVHMHSPRCAVPISPSILKNTQWGNSYRPFGCLCPLHLLTQLICI